MEVAQVAFEVAGVLFKILIKNKRRERIKILSEYTASFA